MTASRAINDRSGVSRETRDHVLKVAADLGYVVNRVAKKLAGGKIRIIGVIASDLDNQYTSSLIESTSKAAWQAGYEILIYSHVEREKHPSGSIVQLLQQVSDGVIAVIPLEVGHLGELASVRIPVITIDYQGKHAEFPCIASNCYVGACAAVTHLINLGHRRIAYISGDERLASAGDRRRAFTEAMSQHGLSFDSALTVKGDFTEKRGFEATAELLSRERPPTAIFAANDLSAFGAVAAIREAGLRVPDDISVVGFDDIPAAKLFFPALTTVRQPLHLIGRSAVNTLLALIARIEPASLQISLPTDLVIRASTAPPRMGSIL